MDHEIKTHVKDEADASRTKADRYTKGPLHCSFCGKAQAGVQRLIAGPGVYICDECVALCVCILQEEPQGKDPEGGLCFRLIYCRPDGSVDRLELRDAPFNMGNRTALAICGHCGTWLVGAAIERCLHCGEALGPGRAERG